MIERRQSPGALIEVKEASGNGFVKVRAASFLSIDRGAEMIVPGAYAPHIGSFAAKGRVFLNHVHSPMAKVGRVISAYEEKSGLIALAKFNSTELAQKTRQMAMEGDLTDISIGHHVVRAWHASAVEVKKIWDRHGYTPSATDLLMLKRAQKIRVIEEAIPGEFSFVGIPMNDKAETLEVKSTMDIETKKGAVLSGPNAKALKQAYRLIRNIFKSARIEDLDEESEPTVTPEGKSAVLDVPAVEPVAEATPAPGKTDAELRAKRLRAEFELMSLELPEVDRVAPSVERDAEEISQPCPVTQV